MTQNQAAPAVPAARSCIRVLVVDDSAVIRGLVARWLGEDPAIEIVGTVGNGLMAVQAVTRAAPDVVILDIEMPVMDGLTALPLIMKAAPQARVVMASTLTRRNAEISLKALSLGAADYVAKPEATRSMTASDEYRVLLIEKVKALGRSARGPARGMAPAAPAGAPAPSASITLRAAGRTPPQILGIGSSTGGPQALFDLLKALGPGLRVPVVITQHMPPTFTTILAEHIGKLTGLPASEGQAGETLRAGHVYVAPGEHHMLVERRGGAAILRLSDAAPENFCRPAVDPMFRSLAQTYGPAALGVILTGMGADGREGGRAIVAAGGTILAQDEATSVVWGMPGAAAQAGICAGVHPLPRLGPEILKLMGGRP